ncbi:MAG: FecR domain-containing protein [Bacteroidales bacterium]|nr:FecR domain-containing protein [Bacteroidales bacterium]
MEEYNKILWERIENDNSPAEKRKAKAAFRDFLRIVGIRDEQSRDYRRFYRAGILWAALSMPLGFMVAWLILGRNEPATWQEVSTRPGETTQIVLSDNTQVTLNGGSTIVYPSSFNDECRQIYFSGEGYFDVQADIRHPFDIITNEARIKVHGTRFNLKSYSDDNILSVGLDEGSVQFTGNSGVVVDMVPGDNLSYDKETGTLQKEFSQESSGLWRKGQYYFKNVTLHDIARDVERLFGVRVLIENEALLHSHYHIALVNGETVDDFIRILSFDSSLKISRSGGTIIIR